MQSLLDHPFLNKRKENRISRGNDHQYFRNKYWLSKVKTRLLEFDEKDKIWRNSKYVNLKYIKILSSYLILNDFRSSRKMNCLDFICEVYFTNSIECMVEVFQYFIMMILIAILIYSYLYPFIDKQINKQSYLIFNQYTFA